LSTFAVTVSGTASADGRTSQCVGTLNALSRSRGSDEDEAAMLRDHEVQASYRTAKTFGIDELIDPRETRNVLLHSLERSLHRRQVPAGPVARVGIAP
jgi:methylmalonyl-CoA decarboxylase subunit alpha